MSHTPCPFCDYATKGVSRTDHLRSHVQRKHPGGGDVAFRDNQGFRMTNPTTEIFLKVKDVNGTEKYGDAFCVTCCSWLGLNAKAVWQSNRISRCEEHICKTKQERRPKLPGAKSAPRGKMDYCDFQKAGLSKYIEFKTDMEFDLAKTLENINVELSKPPVVVEVKPTKSSLQHAIARSPKAIRLYMDSVVKKVEEFNKELCGDGETPDEVTDVDIIMQIMCDAALREAEVISHG